MRAARTRADLNAVEPTRSRGQRRPTYYAMANLVIRGFIDGGNDNTESITNGVGFRNDISYGSIAPPVTYVLFVVFIVLMKAATVYAMRGLKQAK